MVKDTVTYAEHVRRRYHCKCGERWSTYEVLISDEDCRQKSRQEVSSTG